jgi:hypothetical protein
VRQFENRSAPDRVVIPAAVNSGAGQAGIHLDLSLLKSKQNLISVEIQ